MTILEYFKHIKVSILGVKGNTQEHVENLDSTSIQLQSLGPIIVINHIQGTSIHQLTR